MRFMPPASSRSETIDVFENAKCSFLTRAVSCHGTLKDGSSKQGKAWRASVGSNCVNAYHSSPSFMRNSPALLFVVQLPFEIDVEAGSTRPDRVVESEAKKVLARGKRPRPKHRGLVVKHGLADRQLGAEHSNLRSRLSQI